MKYWLMKTEPDEFSIDDLKRVKEESWSGVRNFQARKYMMEEMKVGDTVLIYHSSCKVPGVYGLGRVLHSAEPDKSQFDKKSDYYDPRATKEKPWWYGVRVRYKSTFKAPVTLEAMKADKKLHDLFIFKNGRLSVGPVSEADFMHILGKAQAYTEGVTT